MSLLDTINKNKEQFLKFNSEKYERFQELMPSTNIKKVINSIPLLLCLNHKKVPGYIEGDFPYGISGYEPDGETVKFIQTRFHIPKLEFSNENPAIEMLALMGSVGTIAYTRKSDFDYWACIDRSRFAREDLDALSKKIDLIQKWAHTELKIEVHIFINDIESIKKNIFAEDEEEAFGSTTGAVLKDEFFRSSIVVAGKIPFWWVIPKFISDSEYDRLYSRLPDEYKRDIFVDLGNLYEISREDFLGAALFQLIKSLGNPFKSIIKIGVLEKYLFSPDDTPLLSQRVKQKIIRGQIDNYILDSYILMFEEVYEYYETALEDRSLLKILRQNLYLKIDPQLSKYTGLKKSSSLPYKVVVMFRYVKEWKWTMEEVKQLDDFDNWDYTHIIAFWNRVKKFMLLSYQRISSQLPALDISGKISESDFKLLSRKIRTHFSSSPEKIDNHITFKDTPYEPLLYIEPENITIDTHEWKLFKRNNSNDQRFVSTVLKTDTDLLKLLSWTSINQIYDPVFTRIKIQSGYQRIIQSHILEILDGLSDLMQQDKIKLKNDYFLNEAFCLVNMIVLNFNVEKADSIMTVHHIFQTSWGESYIKKYTEDQEIITLLGEIVQDGLKLKRDFDSFCRIISPEPNKSLYRDMENLFRDTYNFFIHEAAHSKSARLISKTGTLFFTLQRDKSKVTFTSASSRIRLLTYISVKPFPAVNYRFSGSNPDIEVLKEVCNVAKPNHITFAYEKKGNFLIIYIINESGNLFTFFYSYSLLNSALASLYAFIVNTIKKMKEDIHNTIVHDKIFVYSITTDRYGKRSLTNESKQVESVYLTKYDGALCLTAEIKQNETGESLYSILKKDTPVKSFHKISSLPAGIAELKRRYPDPSGMLISDMIFVEKNKDFYSTGTSNYFVEKFKLEYLINKTGA